MKRILLLAAMASSLMASAQLTVKTASGDLNFRMIGRTNFDGGTYIGSEGNDRNGVMVNDTRLGFIASFDEQWTAKVEICFAEKAVSFRDLYLQYAIDKNNYVQMGNFFQPFGAQCLGLAFKFVDDASADKTFCPSRKMGAAFFHTTDKLNLTAGIFSDGNVDAKGLNKGYSLSAKAIYRPIIDSHSVLHFGFAPMFTHTPNAVSLRTVMPCTIDTRPLMSTVAFDADNHSRLEAEAIYISGKFYCEAHYLMSNINIAGGDNFRSHGAYAQASYLIKGEQQNYNKRTGLAAAASPKSLEVLARVSHVALTDDATQTDLTIGLNYFVSKYLNFKLNYIHADVTDLDGRDMVQARVQFSF